MSGEEARVRQPRHPPSCRREGGEREETSASGEDARVRQPRHPPSCRREGDEREETSASGEDATSRRVHDVTERLLGRERVLRRRQVSSGAGLPLLTARRLWHALGFPGLGDDDMHFTDADLDALDHVGVLLRRGALDERLALSMIRALARTLDHLASWQASLVMEDVLGGAGDMPDVPDLAVAATSSREADEPLWHERLTPEARLRAARTLTRLADDLEPLLVYTWRRHLAAAVGQLVEDEPGAGAGLVRTVGFADMVEFTSMVRRLSERQLARLVGDFEALAADVVTAHGGRIVKTLGDEVVFVSERAVPAAAIGIDLVESVTSDQGMPSLRVGLATGPVLSHLGDVFGTTVNRAARLTPLARPDTVVIDSPTATRLGDVSGFEVAAFPPRPLRGLGVTSLWGLRRTTGPTRRGPVSRAEEDGA